MSYNIQNNQQIISKTNNNYLLTKRKNSYHTIESFKSFVDFWLEWSIIHQNCWLIRINHDAAAMQSVPFYLKNTRQQMSWGSPSCVEFGGVDENTAFIPFSGVPPSPSFNSFWGSPMIFWWDQQINGSHHL
jgi:hypothetical protein